jgi:hypothetical protein
MQPRTSVATTEQEHVKNTPQAKYATGTGFANP